MAQPGLSSGEYIPIVVCLGLGIIKLLGPRAAILSMFAKSVGFGLQVSPITHRLDLTIFCICIYRCAHHEKKRKLTWAVGYIITVEIT